MARLRLEMSWTHVSILSCYQFSKEVAYLGGLVFGSGDEICAVCGELNVADQVVELVCLNVLQLLTGLLRQYISTVSFYPPSIFPHLRIVLADATVLVASNDVLGQITPARNCCLALCAGDPQAGFLGLSLQVLIVDIEHGDGTQEAHTLLCDGQQPASIRSEFDPLDSRREVPHLNTLASLHVP